MATVNRLTEMTIRNFKTDKQARLADGNGLYLVVGAGLEGKKTWLFVYRTPEGKQTSKTFGIYPTCSLAEARRRRDKVRDEIQQGLQVQLVEPEAKPRHLLHYGEAVLAKKHALGLSPETLRQAEYSLRLLTALHKVDMGKLTAGDINRALQDIKLGENRYKASVFAREICQLALADQVATTNVALLVDRSLRLRPQTDGYPHLEDRKALGKLMIQMRGYASNLDLAEAMVLNMLTVLRPSELRLGTWGDVDLGVGVYTIPAERAKTRTARVQHLSRQAVEIFRRLKDRRNDPPSRALIFPSLRSAAKPISNAAFGAAFRALGYTGEEITTHGFRKSFSTLAHEAGHDSMVIERCLGHVDHNKIRAVYNKAELLPERQKLMQWWSDELDAMVVEFQTALAFA